MGMGAAALALPVFADDRSVRRPNIVYILADDMGYGDPRCNNEKSKIPTPNMDRLAAQGMRFTDAHSGSAVCTPTRYGVLTGRYSWRTRLKQGVLWGGDPSLIEPGRMTVASLLRGYGYATACFGKWHLGLDWARLPEDRIDPDWPKNGRDIDFTKPFRGGPVDVGFDTFLGIHGSLDMPPYVWLEDDRALDVPREMTREGGRLGRTAEGFKAIDVMPKLTHAVVNYIEDHAKNRIDKPFFVYFPLTAPHTPVVPADAFKGRSRAGQYGDFVFQVDWTIGEVMKALDRLGIADNTLLIVTSDNGPEILTAKLAPKYGHWSNYHFRGRKRDAWDGGHRIAFIARWPAKIKAGITCNETICLTDLMATCAAIVGTNLPDDAGEDSYNILPALLGVPQDTPIREATVHHSSQGEFAIRQGKWKLILCRGSGGNRYRNGPNAVKKDDPPGQLYNIVEDPSEKVNLYRQRPDVVASMKALLDKYKKQGRSRPLRAS
jgi:arylsulfatase A-like enzyme